jgi:hypothetical protein
MIRPELQQFLSGNLIKMLEFNQFEMTLELQGHSCDDRFPLVAITVDGVLEFESVVQKQTIKIAKTFDMQTKNIAVDICYKGKTDLDTKVNADGTIEQNQSVKIENCVVNGVDLISNDIIYKLGHYTKHLLPQQKEYFINNNIDTGPTHSLWMNENGIWSLNFGFPILPELCKKVFIKELHQKSYDENFYNEMYQRIQNIQQLEQLVAEKNNQKITLI